MPSLPPIVPQGSVRPIPLRSLVPSLSDRTFVPPQSFLCMEAFWNAIDTGLGLSATKAEELNTLQVCFRAVVVYLVLIGFIRFAKKRFLSQATAFDVILVIVIGSISSRAVSGTAPFLPSLAGTFVLIFMHWIISYFTRDSKFLGYLAKGKDTVLIRDGKVDAKAMAASHMSEDDLLEDLRHQGVEAPADAKSARLERSGKLSVIKK
jgi:uncharacterized membrane protein YcaP (DUF421 family)